MPQKLARAGEDRSRRSRKQVEPYLEHLLDWDCRITAESTQATLCTAWYEELFGDNYPGEVMKPHYAADASRHSSRRSCRRRASCDRSTATGRCPGATFTARSEARTSADLLDLPFDDGRPSLPSSAATARWAWSSRSTIRRTLYIPSSRTLKNHYGLIGATYMGVYEFGDRIEGATVLHFGQSGDPRSPHFFDQAKLLAERKFKRELFYWDEVLRKAPERLPPRRRAAQPRREGQRRQSRVTAVDLSFRLPAVYTRGTVRPRRSDIAYPAAWDAGAADIPAVGRGGFHAAHAGYNRPRVVFTVFASNRRSGGICIACRCRSTLSDTG